MHHGKQAAKASLAATTSELSDVLPNLAVCVATSGVALAGATLHIDYCKLAAHAYSYCLRQHGIFRHKRIFQ